MSASHDIGCARLHGNFNQSMIFRGCQSQWRYRTSPRSFILSSFSAHSQLTCRLKRSGGQTFSKMIWEGICDGLLLASTYTTPSLHNAGLSGELMEEVMHHFTTISVLDTVSLLIFYNVRCSLFVPRLTFTLRRKMFIGGLNWETTDRTEFLFIFPVPFPNHILQNRSKTTSHNLVRYWNVLL